MKRTIKRYSLELNKGKWETLLELVGAYVKQKDIFLLMLAPAKVFCRYSRHTTVRNELIKQKFVSPTGLQARAWKLSLQDAFETIDQMWLARAKDIRRQVFVRRSNKLFDAQQTHYAFWGLKKTPRIMALISGNLTPPKRIEIDSDSRRQVDNYLRRTIRQMRGRNPRTLHHRSFALDSGMYRIFMHHGRQYIKIATLVPKQRLVIPLTGNTSIRGNIRVVLDFDKLRVEIHYTVDVKPKKAKGKAVAIDLGVTEVMTDSNGKQWGIGFGVWLEKYSDKMNAKGKRRNKLDALLSKAYLASDEPKARNIIKYNLGQKKLRCRRQKMRQTLTREINTAINSLFKANNNPTVIIHEKLDIRGKTKSKRLNRMITLWIRGIIKDRLGFGASVRGSVRKQVNPSYTSQMCPSCGFVHRQNRRGDIFNCKFCKQGGHSDKLAALNLLNRADDLEITRWTPPSQVKQILLNRFCRRLENWDFLVKPDEVNWTALDLVGIPVTVPGKTLDTGPPTCSGRELENGPSISERNCRHRDKGRLTARQAMSKFV